MEKKPVKSLKIKILMHSGNFEKLWLNDSVHVSIGFRVSGRIVRHSSVYDVGDTSLDHTENQLWPNTEMGFKLALKRKGENHKND